jgi:molybdenum cofactor synthesis domain-containing protein
MNEPILNIKSLNISEKKGTKKLPVSEIELNERGVVGDAHAGHWHRQVSLLGVESMEKFSKEAGRNINYGEFAENITTSGALLYQMKPFDRLKSETVELEITQIGKKCHGDNCSVFKEVGNCVMPKEGIFARVLKSGKLKIGDQLHYYPKIYRMMVITMSDRASRGEYQDQSGPCIVDLLNNHFRGENKETEIHTHLIPDDPLVLKSLMQKAREDQLDVVFTTGGTGIGPRDHTPEAVKEILDKEIPGIMEMIRLKYGSVKNTALLSRGVAGVMDKTLVFTLPGGLKAVQEYCHEIFPLLNHSFLMIAGIDSH